MPAERPVAQPRSQEATDAAEDARWQAVVDRDRTADGRFVYSVATTGVYCRPSCGARLPRPENVRFHADTDAAERAGFRACKRCRPNGRAPAEDQASLIAAACRTIEAAAEPPTLDALAAAAGMSRFHFHRIFKSVTGVTPKAYADADRARRVQGALTESRTVTEAIYDAGFNSSGRFYAAAAGRLGMRPTEFRAGGRGVTIRFAVGQCSLGAILVAATPTGISAIQFGDDPDTLIRDLEDRFPGAELVGGDTEFERMVAEIVGFVEAPARGLDLPLDLRGTAFQQRVWQALRAIPAGTTASYADIARRLGQPNAVRAVARACAANPVAVAIPCHRVVRTDGALSGYRWGTDRKRALLLRERAGSNPED
jgi:AraC family transcriptional regulator of adaptative response/methylated-DNA-[protein]-cysteine methyltransferase